jgi:prepilin-type N-terminal cleavage/methylation domain-containing protein
MSIFETESSRCRTDFRSVNSRVRFTAEHSIRLPEKRTDRHGMTLIEISLVLVIFVVVAAFCWPAIGNALNSQRLKKSADIVRTEWSKARVKAMSGDCIILFRYEPNGGRYCVEKLLDTSLQDSAAAGNSDSDPNSTGNSANLGDIASTAEDTNASNNSTAANYPELPEGIAFRECEIQNDSRATVCDQSGSAGQVSNPSSAGKPSSSFTNVSWSSPIYFYPDGTSSSAVLQIGNDRNNLLILTLRGMTGVVKISEGATP